MRPRLGSGRLRTAAVCAALVAVAVLGVCAAWRADPGTRDAGAGAAGVGDVLETAPVSDEVRDLLDGMPADARTEYASVLATEEQAKAILSEYQARGDCVVARSGWLDLFGKTWSCVIQGEGWVDICVVQESGDGGSDVGVMRLDASALSGVQGG